MVNGIASTCGKNAVVYDTYIYRYIPACSGRSLYGEMNGVELNL